MWIYLRPASGPPQSVISSSSMQLRWGWLVKRNPYGSRKGTSLGSHQLGVGVFTLTLSYSTSTSPNSADKSIRWKCDNDRAAAHHYLG